MDYGVEEETSEIDDIGSSLTVVRRWHGGIVAKKERKLKIREKVFDAEQELDEYLKFQKFIKENPGKYDFAFGIIKPKNHPSNVIDGGYFVEKCWTELA